MSDEEPLPLPRRRRGVRLLSVSWERLEQAASAANTLGVQTRRREVLDALVEAHASASERKAANLIREYRLAGASSTERVMRDLRLLESSWAGIALTVEAANRLGMAVRDRDVLDALIIGKASADPEAAARLVRAHRRHRYGDDAPPRVRT